MAAQLRSAWSEQLAQFYPRPFGEALSEKLRISGLQRKTWDETPLCAVRFAEHPPFAAATCNLGKTAIVGPHEAKDRTGRRL